MHDITRNMIPVRSGVHGGDWIACDVVSPGMGGRCIFSILVLLQIRLHQLKCAFICIDAVDELEQRVRQQLLNVLKELVANNNTRLLLTGRGHIESEVQRYFKPEQIYQVVIRACQQDIQEFVEQQIKDDLNSGAMDEVLKKGIIDAIIKKSEGM